MFPSLYGVVSQGAAAASWWVVAGKTCVAAYQPIGAASLAASYTNLANPGTYNAAPGVAPTWASATGWTFNGTQYLTSGVVPAAGYTAIARFSNGFVTGNRTLLGSLGSGSTYFTLYNSNAASDTKRYANGGAVSIATRVTNGIMAVAGQQGYYNGVADGGTIGAWSGTSTYGVLIGNLNVSGTPSTSFFIGDIQAIAIYSDTLSGAEVAILSAAMAALT